MVKPAEETEETEEQEQTLLQPTNAKRIPKKGVVTAEDLGPIADAFIALLFPEDAHQVNSEAKYGTKNKKTGKTEVSGYRSQYIINALNEIIGPGNWREYGTEEVEKPATAYTCVYRGTFEIGNWKNTTAKRTVTHPDGTIEEITLPTSYFEVLAQFGHTGGSRNMDKWESIKGARTNFLKKVCSYIGNGWRAYALVMDEDFESLPPENEKPTPSVRPEVPKNAGTEPTDPATATAKLISSVERDQIINLFNQMGYAPEEVPERVKSLEDKMKKHMANFTQGQARDIIKNMQRIIEDKKAVDQASAVPKTKTSEEMVAELQARKNSDEITTPFQDENGPK